MALLSICFPSGSLAQARQWMPVWLALNKKPGPWVSKAFPCGPHFTYAVTTCAGEVSSPAWHHWEGTSACLHLVSLDFTAGVFSLCWLCFVSFCNNHSKSTTTCRLLWVLWPPSTHPLCDNSGTWLHILEVDKMFSGGQINPLPLLRTSSLAILGPNGLQ